MSEINRKPKVYPDRQKTKYTKMFAFRIEESLKEEIDELKKHTKKDVTEAIRIAMREIVLDLKPLVKEKAS